MRATVQNPSMLALLLVCPYAVIGYLSWRNVPFSQPRKAVFALTAFPLFLIAMFFNIWLTDNFLPELIDAFSAAHVEAEELIKQGVGTRQARRLEAGTAFLVSVPVPAFLTACWYWLIRIWERKAGNSDVGP
ncbi:MAG: hypothetical protein JWP22_1733 [Ramlibacter sp.]|nr:hypothetical protein [Ramlibacter sp.]